jgi:molybdate transport repressor ModE-like protein
MGRWGVRPQKAGNAQGVAADEEEGAAMDLEDFSSFWYVARHKSISGAARDVGCSQSTLSKRLQRIEAELGVTLVERRQGSTGALRLTEQGEAFLAASTDIMARYEAMLREIRQPSRGVTEVTYAAPLRACFSKPLQRLARVLADACAPGPSGTAAGGSPMGGAVRLKPVAIGSSSSLDMLESGEADLAFEPYAPCIEKRGLSRASLFTLPAMVVVSEGCPLAVAPDSPLDPRALDGMRCVVSIGHGSFMLRRHLEAMQEAAGISTAWETVDSDDVVVGPGDDPGAFVMLPESYKPIVESMLDGVTCLRVGDPACAYDMSAIYDGRRVDSGVQQVLRALGAMGE